MPPEVFAVVPWALPGLAVLVVAELLGTTGRVAAARQLYRVGVALTTVGLAVGLTVTFTARGQGAIAILPASALLIVAWALVRRDVRRT